MPKYLTKHSPVDDQPFIVYAGNTDNVPDIQTSISIESTKSIAQGGNYTFPVTRSGVGDPNATVTWSLDVESGGTIKSGTTLTQAGKLTVDASQATGKKLYVTASDAYGHSSKCTVTVTSS